MLVTRVGAVICAFSIEDVVETMRPLPIEPIGHAGDPALAAIAGVAMIRGAPVAVVDARKLLGVAASGAEPARRFVVVRSAAHRIALAVDAVIDVRRIDRAALSRLPPLLEAANRASVAAIGSRDEGLLVVLDAMRLLPEAGWRAIGIADARGGTP
jgi:purine-binding chemotaxis protein CheW